MSFTITRTGKFDTYCVPQTAHCGLKDGANSFKYRVAICVEDNALDGNGFVIDNSELKSVWEHFATVNLSCELTAMKCARELSKKMFHVFPLVHSIEVEIWGLPDASVEFRYEREMANAAKKVAPYRPR